MPALSTRATNGSTIITPDTTPQPASTSISIPLSASTSSSIVSTPQSTTFPSNSTVSASKVTTSKDSKPASSSKQDELLLPILLPLLILGLLLLALFTYRRRLRNIRHNSRKMTQCQYTFTSPAMTSAFATECLPTSPPPSYTLDTLISEAYPPTPTTPNTPYYPTESLETKHKHASFKTTLTNILTLLVFFKNPTSKSSKSKTPSPSPSKKPSRLFRRSSKEQPRNNSTTSTKHLSPSESTAYWNTVCDPSGRLTPEPFGRLTPSPEPFTSDRLSPEPFLSSPYSGERPGSRFSMRSKTQALCPPQTPSSRHSTSSNVLSLHAFAEPISPPPSPPPPSKRSRNDLPRRDSTIHGPNPEEDEIVAFDSLSIYSKFPSPPHTSPLSMLPPMPPPSGSLPPLPTDLSSSKSLKRKRIEVKKIEHVEPEVEEEDGEDIHPFFWAPY